MRAPLPAIALALLATGGIARGVRLEAQARDQSKLVPGEPLGAVVTVSVQPETLTVGEPFTVRIRVRASKIAIIRFPAVPDSADAIEAVDPRSIEERGDASVIDRTAVYRLVAWDVGMHRPRFANVVVSQAGSEQAFATNVGTVLVRSLLPADSASRVPKPVREPLPTPSGLWRYLLLAALALLGFLWYGWRRFRRRTIVVPAGPDAFTEAQARFAALEKLGLAASGEAGRDLIAHVDVLRCYFARRFPDALESLTSGELVAVLESQETPAFPQRVAALTARDAAVRFAHAAILPGEAVGLAREAVAIVSDVHAAEQARLKALERGPQLSRRGRRA